jgi:hypothetical protein
VASVVLFPFWAMVAWTIWQKPGGASVARRLVLSVVMIIGALLLIPLVVVIPWTRRWYWFWRTAQSPSRNADPNAALDWVWDRVSSKSSKASHTTPAARATTPPISNPAGQPFRDPWRYLVNDAYESQARFNVWLQQTPPGPGREHLMDVAEYVDAVAASCFRAATRGQMIQGGIGNRPEFIAQRLQTAEQEALSPDASPAIVATIKSLKSESASLRRMRTTVTELQAELERLCAQLSALVTQALEMTWITLEQAGHSRLTDDLGRLLDDFDNLQGTLDSFRDPGRQTSPP